MKATLTITTGLFLVLGAYGMRRALRFVLHPPKFEKHQLPTNRRLQVSTDGS